MLKIRSRIENRMAVVEDGIRLYLMQRHTFLYVVLFCFVQNANITVSTRRLPRRFVSIHAEDGCTFIS